ncbi:GNAT family N-acetyltransferase [Patescibacteria group bacterium]|nr:GNAT family N-acetyltransferase [Patescibacteria group bacterium]
MIKTDMPEVLSIENDCFKSPWVEELPWLEEDFIRCLRQRNCFGMVGEHDDRVISFMIYQLNKHQISVLKFAVSPKEHRRGVGTQMIQKLKGKVCDQRRNIIALDVGENNYAAHLFNRANGFRVENILGDLDDYPEDIYISKYRSKHNLRRRDKFHITNRVSRLAG